MSTKQKPTAEQLRKHRLMIAKLKTLLRVEVLEPKPNPMFDEWTHRNTRFLRFNRHVPCAACGKKSRIPWTMLIEFKAGDVEHSFVELKFYPKTFAPLTPVCSDHPIGPAV